MRARDLAVEYETVNVDSDAMEAARLMAEHNLPGLLVVDRRGEPRFAVRPTARRFRVSLASQRAVPRGTRVTVSQVIVLACGSAATSTRCTALMCSGAWLGRTRRRRRCAASESASA